ncbi:MAG: hypothetical protein JW982_05050 [Spirochaetes bacterium]|nr:hypothetical protein [Spirochaetota bacterium]
MISGSQTYLISSIEMIRRRKPYTTLLISLFSGMIFPQYSRFLNHPVESASCFSVIIFLLFISRLLCFKTFRNFEKIKIILTDREITRITHKTEKHCIYETVTGVRIKRTVRNEIREIKLFNGSKLLISISAFENFNEFRNSLTAKISSMKKIKIKEFKEPLDFDHPLFPVCQHS